MAIADELIGLLGFKLEGQQNLKKYNEGLDKAEKKTKKVGKVIGAGLAMGATIAVATTKKFAGLERQMNRIGITAGASSEATIKATEDVQKLATDLSLPIDGVVSGLDTLVASGMDLEEAMAFLPSVARAAQASGASLEDIANTAQKASSALGIEADGLDKMFDILVQGGKDGQFELKDMAQYIPELANSFATLGYEGEEGLKHLVALLQTIREDTGSASSAATQAQNIFGKMYSEETAKKFGKMGIDLRKEMKAGIAAGEDAIAVFTRLSNEAIDGDLSKLPLLFTDQEFRLGMTSLMTSGESLEKFFASLNSTEVDGAVFRDLNRILGDTQSELDKTANQFDRLLNNVGKMSAPAVSGVLEFFNSGIEKQEAIAKANKERGMTTTERLLFGLQSQATKDQRAREGGYVPQGDAVAEDAAKNAPAAYVTLGRRPNRPVSRTPTKPVNEADAPFADISPRLAEITAAMQDLSARTNSDVTATDARQDNRQFPFESSVVINQTVNQASDAPSAAASATGNAVSKSVASQRSQIETEPSF